MTAAPWVLLAIAVVVLIIAMILVWRHDREMDRATDAQKRKKARDRANGRV